MKFKNLKSIRIGSWNVPILLKKNNEKHPLMKEECYSLFCPVKKEIWIYEDRIKERGENLNEIILHEILHGVYCFLGLEPNINHNHELIEPLTFLLYSIFNQLNIRGG